jgi:hypothetical protein
LQVVDVHEPDPARALDAWKITDSKTRTAASLPFLASHLQRCVSR